jgi:hypothetical protein
MLVIGTTVWDKDVFVTLGLHKVKILTDNLPHYRFNEAFMAFGAVGVAFNVVTRFVFSPLDSDRL